MVPTKSEDVGRKQAVAELLCHLDTILCNFVLEHVQLWRAGRAVSEVIA